MGKQRGAYLVVLAVSLPALIALVGLVVDTWHIILTVQKAQHAADAASLAAVESLRNPNLLVGFRDVKYLVLSILAESGLPELDSPAAASLATDTGTGTFRYDDANTGPSANDLFGYMRLGGERGNLRILVGRGVFCYSPVFPGFQRNWYSLEVGSRYCIANSVTVEIHLADVRTFLLNALGIRGDQDIVVSATSWLDPAQTCGVPLCSSLGAPDTTSDYFGTHFLPSAACP